MALSSSSAMDEILGVSRSETATPFPQDSPSIPDTPSDTQDDLKLQELRTSSKSVMDYFKEKLLAKSNSKSTSASTNASPAPGASTPPSHDDYDDRPRSGLGLGAARGLGSRLHVETTYEEDTETSRTGLGAASRMSAMFAAASSFVSASGDIKASEEVIVTETDTVVVPSKEKKSKAEKKEKKKDRKKESVDGEEVDVKVKSKSKKRKDDGADANDEDSVVPHHEILTEDAPEKLGKKSKKRSELEIDAVEGEEGEKKKKRKKEKGKKSDSS